MTVQEVARNVMKITHMTQADVAEKAGLSGQGAVGMFLQSKSMRIDSLLTILNACGYELVARSVDDKLPEFIVGERLTGKADSGSEDMQAMIRRIVTEEIRKMARDGR